MLRPLWLLTSLFLLTHCDRAPLDEQGPMVTLQTLSTTGTSPRSLYVVAHQDDDILFMNPHLLADLQSGAHVFTVYVTAGDAGLGEAYWGAREAGARAAYDAMMGDNPNRWHERVLALSDGSSLTSFTDNKHATLIFLRLPDGNVPGTGFATDGNESLQHLWDGSIGQMHAVDGSRTVTRNGLVALLATLMADIEPRAMHFLDCTGSHGHDHSDHLHSAMFAYAALQQVDGVPLAMYRGYNISTEPNNLTPAQFTTKLGIFDAYLPFDTRQCPADGPCTPPNDYVLWAHRQYPDIFDDPDEVTCMP